MKKKINDIHLYTAPTMNGWKPIIFLEEAGVRYDLTEVNFSKKEQKLASYIKLNPNGRIPTIVDRSKDNFVVFESGAILIYLAQKYQKFLPNDPKQKSLTLQWLMFQVSNLGPMMGQAMYFQRIAPLNGVKDTFAIKRYVSESLRLLKILDHQLISKKYLVGNSFTIADIAMYPWAKSHYWAKVSIDGLVHLNRWLKLIDSRKSTQSAMKIPRPILPFFGKGDIKSHEKLNSINFKHDV